MNRFSISLIFVLALVLLSCNFSPLTDTVALEDDSLYASEEILLNVDITGGFAGVQQELTVDAAGKAEYIDSLHPGALWRVQLSSTELDTLQNLFTRNGFPDLSSRYIDERVADAFQYEVSYPQSPGRVVVVTDYFGAPENLKQIIDGILQLRACVVEGTPRLELQLSKTVLQSGEPIDLQLILTNESSEEMVLSFSSGQIFEFSATTRGEQTEAEVIVWTWSHDMFFTQAGHEIALKAGTRESYTISWDGRDNAGRRLTGTFSIRADLTSMPGGSAVEMKLAINE